MFLLLLGLFITDTYCLLAQRDSFNAPRLVVLFLDGLRFDYLQDTKLSGMQQLLKTGYSVPNLKPIFPSDCHANIHALFTGKNHYHPDYFSESFRPNFSSQDLLWNAAARQGKRVRLFHFPFCEELESLGQGVNPENFQCKSPISEAQSLSTTIDQVLSQMNEQSIDFAGVYYGGLDRVAHSHGPSSAQLRSGPIAEVDAAVNLILEYLTNQPDFQNINFVILGDHGVAESEGVIYFDRLIKWDMIHQIINLGGSIGLWPSTNSADALVSRLSGIHNTRLFNSSNWPASEWGPVPAPPVLLVADAGFIFHSRYHLPLQKHFNYPTSTDKLHGYHGYPPDEETMHTALYAVGPAFKSRDCPRGCVISSTPDVHHLLKQLLDVGSTAGPASFGLDGPASFVYLLLVIVCLLCCLFVAAVCFLLRRRRGYSKQVDVIDQYDHRDEKEQA